MKRALTLTAYVVIILVVALYGRALYEVWHADNGSNGPNGPCDVDSTESRMTS